MDISLDQALETGNKHQDSLEDENSSDLLQEVSILNEVKSIEKIFEQVTYRVVQVGGADDNQQATLSIVSSNGLQNIIAQGAGGSGSSQVAIVANPFNGENEGGNNNVADNQGAKFAYFPSASGSASNNQEISSASDNQDQSNVAPGQFYVMMSPQDMMQNNQGSRSLVPRAGFVQKMDTNRQGVTGMRDTTRRVQHNEVERRRRDKINTWIMKLSKLVPDCASDHTKQGQSKGGILAKTCDYIRDLQSTSQLYVDRVKEFERIQLDHEVLRLQFEEKKQENNILRQMLQSHGIEVAITSTSNSR